MIVTGRQRTVAVPMLDLGVVVNQMQPLKDQGTGVAVARLALGKDLEAEVVANQMVPPRRDQGSDIKWYSIIAFERLLQGHKYEMNGGLFQS